MTSKTNEVPFRNFAPEIVRQRLVIEGLVSEPLTEKFIYDLLIDLSEELNMHMVDIPLIRRVKDYGYCGFMNWTESGCHFYTYQAAAEKAAKGGSSYQELFTLDIYTCKKFDPVQAANFVAICMDEYLITIDWKEV